MNSATVFIRACRARPAASKNLIKAQSQKTAPSSLLGASSRTRSLPCRQRTLPAQREFSSQCYLKQAQPINDDTSASSAGLDATLLGKASAEASNLPTSILSHAPTDSSASPTPPSLQTPQSYDLPLLPANLPESDLSFLLTTPTTLATVTRTNTMNRTVRATHNIQTFHAPYQKHYTRPTHALVHDPHNLLREGDVIRYGEFPPSLRAKRDAKGQTVQKSGRPVDRNGRVKELGVQYLVREIVSPFGVALGSREAGSVGGVVGRWKGTEGEARKMAVRQLNRKDGSKKAKKTAGARKAREQQGEAA